jgi:hypothetical protein
MAEALKMAIEIERLPSLDEISGTTPLPPKPIYMEDVTNRELAAEFPIPIENYFQLFVVYDEIPAGLPGPVAYQPSPTHPAGHDSLQANDYLEVTRVQINEQEYLVRSLVIGKNRVNLISDKPHYILRVRGNSMNKAGIDDGDLVVVRSQMTADNSQIVAAEIIGVDVSRATLKRYSRRGKQVVLQAESSDPEYSDAEWEFEKDSENSEDGFFIRGIAVAVLKPLAGI